MKYIREAELRVERGLKIRGYYHGLVWKAVKRELERLETSAEYDQLFTEPKSKGQAVCLIVVAGMDSHKYVAFNTLLHTLERKVRYGTHSFETTARYVDDGPIYINLFATLPKIIFALSL